MVTGVCWSQSQLCSGESQGNTLNRSPAVAVPLTNNHTLTVISKGFLRFMLGSPILPDIHVFGSWEVHVDHGWDSNLELSCCEATGFKWIQMNTKKKKEIFKRLFITVFNLFTDWREVSEPNHPRGVSGWVNDSTQPSESAVFSVSPLFFHESNLPCILSSQEDSESWLIQTSDLWFLIQYEGTNQL